MKQNKVVVSPHAKAIVGLELIKEAIIAFLSEYPDGIRNGELAKKLSLESSHDGAQKDYLTYSALGLLMAENRVSKQKYDNNNIYTLLK